MSTTQSPQPGRFPRPVAANSDVALFVMVAIVAAVAFNTILTQPGVPEMARWVVGSVSALAVLVLGFGSGWVRQ